MTQHSDPTQDRNHVFLEILVQGRGKGFMYRALATTAWGQKITVEGWAAGSRKEVERVVQRRIQKIIDEGRKRTQVLQAKQEDATEAPPKEVLHFETACEEGDLNDAPKPNAPAQPVEISEADIAELLQDALDAPMQVSYTTTPIGANQPIRVTYSVKPNSEGKV